MTPMLKITLFGVFGVMHHFYTIYGKIIIIIFHIPYIIVAPL